MSIRMPDPHGSGDVFELEATPELKTLQILERLRVLGYGGGITIPARSCPRAPAQIVA